MEYVELGLIEAFKMGDKLTEALKGTMLEGKTINDIFHCVKADGTVSSRMKSSVKIPIIQRKSMFGDKWLLISINPLTKSVIRKQIVEK